MLNSGEDMSRAPPTRRLATTVFPHMSVASRRSGRPAPAGWPGAGPSAGSGIQSLDGPLGAHDLGPRRQMHEELLHPGATFAHLAHGQAVNMADMIAALNFRPGGESGPARIRLKPAARCAATFMGSSRPRRARVSSPGATSTAPECAVVSWRRAPASVSTSTGPIDGRFRRAFPGWR